MLNYLFNILSLIKCPFITTKINLNRDRMKIKPLKSVTDDFIRDKNDKIWDFMFRKFLTTLKTRESKLKLFKVG